MKRKAVDQGPAEKRLRELPQKSASTQNSAYEDSGSQSGSKQGSDATSTNRDGENLTPTTALTTTSTGRRKFPSEHKNIKCTFPDCDKFFNRPARLAAHIRSHNQDRPFKCMHENCDKSYTEAKHLKQHIIGSHTEERQYVCQEPDCGRGFTTGTKLRRHAAVHEGKERFRCRGYEGCEQTFRKHNTLQRHIRTEHLGEKAFLCNEEGCGASYDTTNGLKRHADREHGDIRFWCDECCDAAAKAPEGEEREPVGFTTQVLLDAHIRHEHVNCIFCDIKFKGQYELDQHMEIYHSGLAVEDRKTVPCDFEGCEKKFTKRNNMRAHYKTAHEGKRFICGQTDTWASLGLENWNWTEEGCAQGFISKLKLEEHVAHMHLGKRRPKTDCTNSIRTNVNLLDEVSGVADEQRRNVLCNEPGCTARFIRYADLHKHIRAEHPDAPPPTQEAPAVSLATGGLRLLQEHNDGALSDNNPWVAANDLEFDLSALQEEDDNMRGLVHFDVPTLNPNVGHSLDSILI